MMDFIFFLVCVILLKNMPFSHICVIKSNMQKKLAEINNTAGPRINVHFATSEKFMFYETRNSPWKFVYIKINALLY